MEREGRGRVAVVGGGEEGAIGADPGPRPNLNPPAKRASCTVTDARTASHSAYRSEDQRERCGGWCCGGIAGCLEELSAQVKVKY